jgi:hypothetical protein
MNLVKDQSRKVKSATRAEDDIKAEQKPVGNFQA